MPYSDMRQKEENSAFFIRFKGGTAKMRIFDIFDIFGRIFWAFLAFFRGEK